MFVIDVAGKYTVHSEGAVFVNEQWLPPPIHTSFVQGGLMHQLCFVVTYVTAYERG